jgi:isopropylmalate/homocitrate/citramalate synthase
MPGVVFTPEEKTALAIKSSEFGCSHIDIMPAVSDSERALTKELTQMGLSADIIAATMLKKDHVDLAADCDADGIILFTPLSDLHLEYKLRTTREENTKKALEMVDYARERGLSVNFAGEDATRADMDYVTEFVQELSGRIDYFMPCDTLGCLTPQTTHEFIKRLKEGCKTKLILHVHNDFGLATANTLAGIAAGAEMFSGTFCGIGERAGNAPIEEVCVGLRFLHGIEPEADCGKLTEICGLVENYSRIRLQAHKPLVGENAFTHESGIHIDGILKHPGTYENFDPESIGQKRRFLFGKHTGKAVLKHILEKHGIICDNLDRILDEIKETATSVHRSLTEDEVIRLIKDSRYSIGRRAQEVAKYSSLLPP